jgi:hypothetical protein
MRLRSIPFLGLLGISLACAAPEGPAERTALGMAPSSSPAFAAASAATPVPAAPAKGVPTRIPLTIRETAGVARSGEVVRSGVPLPRTLGVRDPRSLAIVGPDGRPVPAEFHVLARWNAGKDEASAPVQWLLVVFPATVAARGSAVYTLVADGSAGENPPPPAPLRLTRSGSQVVIDTGAAVFKLGKDPGALFDEVLLPGGRRLVAGSRLELRAGGRQGGHGTVRDVRIESAGPLSAVVVIDGAYDLPPVGQGSLGSRRRYVFTAGSPTAVVRQAVAWEGSLECPGCVATKDGRPNAVLIEKARDALALDLGSPRPAAATVVGAFKKPALEATLGAPAAPGEDLAWVRQVLRDRRTAPLRFEAAAGGERRQGSRADGGMLAASGPAGSVAVAFNHLHRYEPQALRLLADGRLAVDLADDKAWLANHQGLFATFGVTVLAASPQRADLDRLLWAPLNRPLRAWPEAAWFTASEAVDEVPAGTLPGKLAEYDKLIPAVLQRTSEKIDDLGLPGLMTFGVYPRYWGEPGVPGEIECKDDPTPGQDWDNLFWCGAWTDYHNTTETAAIWAERSGEVEWLDELAFPAALRTLHTQIMQCGPDEAWFYCGQAPTGYAAYRADFNSSHQYFENLFLYYWLTGDSTVVDVLRRGGDSMRRLLCPSRGPAPVARPHGPDGPACAATHPPDNDSAVFTGRVAGQWLNAFRFLGLASDDASFLDDYRSGLARAVTQHYTELARDGRVYGFLSEKVVTGPGTSEAGPAWTNGFYDAENLYRLQRDTGDAPIGEPPLPPSRVLAAVARTLAELDPGQQGSEALEAPWARLLAITWTGPRIGGTLVKVEPKDRELYNPEKFGTVALLVRSGRQTEDPALLATGEGLVRLILRQAHSNLLPLGKIQGQTLTRLHPAVALLAEPTQERPEKPERKP